MSEEKTMTPVDRRPHAAPPAGAGAVAAPLPNGTGSRGQGTGDWSAAVTPPSHVMPASASIVPPRDTPSLARTIGLFAGLLIVVNLLGWVWFGSQMMIDGGLVVSIILVATGVHLIGNHKAHAVAAAAGLALLLLATWHHAFAEMWMRWFPAWETHKALPLTTRLSAGDSYYSHGPLVPIASLVICYLIHQRVGIPTGVTRRSRTWGGIVFGCSVFLQLVAARSDVNFASGFALIGIIAGTVILWGGWPLARAYWLPIVFLLFMVPLPMDTIAKINYQLKTVASTAAVWITNRVFGVVAVLDGATVHLAPAADGAEKKLVVENVCGGLRSMISLICFGTLFALVCRVKGYWRWLMLALAVPLAIGCNIARITSMNLVSHYFSVEAAGEDSWFHMASGIMVFALALAAMFGIERLIIFASTRWKKDWVDQRLLGYLDELPPSKSDGLRMHHPVALSSLVVVCAMTTWWVYEEAKVNRGDVARNAVPREMVIAGEKYQSIDGEMSKTEMAILQTTDYLKRRYGNGRYSDAKREVDLTIVFSANNRKGTHPPDVCLEGAGGRIVSKQLHEVSFESVEEGKAVSKQVEVRELVSELQGFQTLHLYIYKCGDTYTPEYLTQQLIIFVNGLINRNSTGALIRVDVQIGRPDPLRLLEARKQALTAAAAFLPKIDQGLP